MFSSVFLYIYLTYMYSTYMMSSPLGFRFWSAVMLCVSGHSSFLFSMTCSGSLFPVFYFKTRELYLFCSPLIVPWKKWQYNALSYVLDTILTCENCYRSIIIYFEWYVIYEKSALLHRAQNIYFYIFINI